MSGDDNCYWSGWYKARWTDYDENPTDWTANNIAHSRLLLDLRNERKATGEIVVQEGQGGFRLERPSGLAVSGRPDLVTISGNVVTVYEAKTRARPRRSDRVQVMIYIYCLRETNIGFRGKEIRGAVRYEDGTQSIVEASEVGIEFASHFDRFLRLFEAAEEADRVPSPYECRWCHIPGSICKDRLEWTGTPDDNGGPF